ncbi:precorrin-6A synthase (deacetylating) [Corynebacterium gerontici]|uniref:Precorrin-2 C(20)-methyltransferase n=1 Tax=Corynebacterium gerontici TaxID=2079234 RepID=A0A3G6J1Y2_9CORY|nr:precorrin-6A synthase (deacetylating) [Corynebacterium gerontici]AZA10988.1 Precorrin-2 C(20)-methyltransferase [Corynebacterium gerontici]
MRTIYVIGIGAGDPELLTLKAIRALERADAVIALDKGDAKSDLLALREHIVHAHAPDLPIVTVQDPPRDRNPEHYAAEVRRWHAERARLLADAIRKHTNDSAAFLVWGDPSLYDSTLRIIERMQRHEGLECTVEVIPGVTAIQLLTAEHKMLLNRIGEDIHVTTARNLAKASPKDRRNCVVMLDGGAGWLDGPTHNTYMWWGAYLGTEHQVLREGFITEIGEEVAALKQQLREQHGWIMDIYLLRELDEATPENKPT